MLDAGADVDAPLEAAGGALDVAIGVGTVTVGSGPDDVGSEPGLATSAGTGAAAISAVPAP